MIDQFLATYDSIVEPAKRTNNSTAKRPRRIRRCVQLLYFLRYTNSSRNRRERLNARIGIKKDV